MKVWESVNLITKFELENVEIKTVQLHKYSLKKRNCGF